MTIGANLQRKTKMKLEKISDITTIATVVVGALIRYCFLAFCKYIALGI